MTYFAVVLTRIGERWLGDEPDLADCESVDDLAETLRDRKGDVRLLFVEQDDEYAAIVRLDGADHEPRAFLTNGHSADEYPMAALVAEDLAEIGGDELDGDEDAPPAHDTAPFGDADIVADLGVPAASLLEMCAHEGTLPVDLLLAVCEKAGCVEQFEQLRG